VAALLLCLFFVSINVFVFRDVASAGAAVLMPVGSIPLMMYLVGIGPGWPWWLPPVLVHFSAATWWRWTFTHDPHAAWNAVEFHGVFLVLMVPCGYVIRRVSHNRRLRSEDSAPVNPSQEGTGT
jgi:hypothetical protein